MKTLDPDYLAPKQFSKMAEGSDDFAYACVHVEFRFHLGHLYCLRLCLRFILSFIIFLFACTCFANENQV